jgi:GTP pyrophosphokinase
MVRFDDIETQVKRCRPDADLDADLDLLRRVYIYSAKEHRDQKRAVDEPYLVHPLSVAKILADMGLDVATVSAGLLHDVVEDKLVKLDNIKSVFGDEIAHLIDGVTKLSKLDRNSRKEAQDESRRNDNNGERSVPDKNSKKEAQAENLRKMVLAIADDTRIVLVKFADLLHNLREPKYVELEKRRRIAQETLEVYAPIAHRLGMSKIRAELEDLAFQYLKPKEYRRLKEEVEKSRASTEAFLEKAKAKIAKCLAKEKVPFIRIEGRVKRPYSIYLKMKRLPMNTLDEVYDLAATRIITVEESDCYGALAVIHKYWRPAIEKVPNWYNDYIKNPRENGYQSLHTRVWAHGERNQVFEVQIRTEKMHRVAEEGVAAHWKYKEGKGKDTSEDEAIREKRLEISGMDDSVDSSRLDSASFKVTEQTLTSLKREGVPDDVLEKLQRIKDQEVNGKKQFLELLKTKIGNEPTARFKAPILKRAFDSHYKKIYALTPKGKVIQLQPKATPVDFAYAIHTEIGNQCTRAKVDGVIKQLSYQIQTGDVVEIITTPGHRPNPDWLKFVVTPRARNKIKHWIAERQRAESVEIGRKIFEKEASKLRLKTKQALEDPRLAKFLNDNGYAKVEDMLAAIGHGKLMARTVLARFVPQVTDVVKRALRLGDDRILIKDIDEAMVYRAPCCNPISGEEIIGYITRGKGVGVHAKRCKNAANLMVNRERIIEVVWDRDNNSNDKPREVKPSVITEDKQG